MSLPAAEKIADGMHQAALERFGLQDLSLHEVIAWLVGCVHNLERRMAVFEDPTAPAPVVEQGDDGAAGDGAEIPRTDGPTLLQYVRTGYTVAEALLSAEVERLKAVVSAGADQTGAAQGADADPKPET